MANSFPTPPARVPLLNPNGGVSNTWLDWFNKIRGGTTPTRTFSIYKTAPQTITSGSWTKITWDVTEWSTVGSDLGNNSFAPTQPGYYHIVAYATLQSGSFPATNIMNTTVALYKNGSPYHEANSVAPAGTSVQVNSISCLVYLNGKTDYVDVWIYSDNAGATYGTLQWGNPFNCKFQGILFQQ